MKYFILTLILAFATAMANAADLERVDAGNICYIPFGTGTLVPVTIQNIDTSCEILGKMPIMHVSMIEEIISHAKVGSISENHIRAKISSSGGGSIFIDDFGGVKIGSLLKSLSREELQQVQKLIEVNIVE